MSSRINHPDHYTQGDIECIQAIEAALGKDGALAYCRGCAIKYLWRCLYKKSPKKDLQKAEWYVQRAQQYVEDGAKEVSEVGNAPTSTESEILCGLDSVRYSIAKQAGWSHWPDTRGRVHSINNPPEGDY